MCLVQLFEVANLYALHAKRVTIMSRDLELVRRVAAMNLNGLAKKWILYHNCKFPTFPIPRFRNLPVLSSHANFPLVFLRKKVFENPNKTKNQKVRLSK